MTTTEQAYEQARKLGAEDGLAAAGWMFDGNTTRETYAAVLRGIEDGDPEILDTLPAPDLSGEWADGRTPESLALDCGLEVNMSTSDADAETVTGLCEEYEQAFNTAADAEIQRVARYHLAD